MYTTVGVRGGAVHWPAGCSCCGQDTQSFRTVEQVFETSDNHAPVERKVTVRASQRIPMCAACRAHVEGSQSLENGCLFSWIGSVVLSAAVYFWLLVDMPAPWNYASGVAFLAASTFVSWRVMNNLFKGKATELTPTCAHQDGVVRYTGFVAPTEVRPSVQEVHRFTFNNEAYLRKFMQANADHLVRYVEADNWEGSPQYGPL